ncbi:MAG TPA: NAD(P)-dependent oxidoreductase [Ktedonobacteraceae bacterium]
MTEHIGFIGTGNMGLPMARNLLRAGCALRVYDLNEEQVAPLVALGAQRVNSPREVVEAGGIVITMVPDDTALERVVLGKEGILLELEGGGIHLCMSTISPGFAAELTRVYAGQHSTYLAATVFGGPAEAAAGRLAILLAGPHAAKARVQSLLQVLGQRIFDFGEHAPAANVVTLAATLLIASALEAIAEATTLVEKHGVERSRFIDLLGLTLFNCPVYTGYGSMIAQHRYLPALLRMPLGLKDMQLCPETARQVHVPVPLAHLVSDRLQAAINRGREALDWSGLALSVSEEAGLPVGRGRQGLINASA